MFLVLLASTPRTRTPFDVSLQIFAECCREDKSLKAVRNVVGILLTILGFCSFVKFRRNLVFPIQSQGKIYTLCVG